MTEKERQALVQVQQFEDSQVRTSWNEQEEEWYFSVVDVVGVLTESETPRRYWSDLKRKLTDEGSQLVTNCNQLKMKAEDGYLRFATLVNTGANSRSSSCVAPLIRATVSHCSIAPSTSP